MKSKWLFRVLAFVMVWFVIFGMGLALISPLLYEGTVLSILSFMVFAGSIKHGWLVS